MFKKSMAALAVLSLSAGLASASEVTLYGIVDNGLLYKHSRVETNGVSTKTDSFALESGISSPSRFGIKGSEDLGNGMKVSFQLENGFKADSGEFKTEGKLFDRQATVALSSGQELVGEMCHAFQQRRDYMVSRINAMEGVHCLKPEGAFYVLMNIEKVLGKTLGGALIRNDEDFATALLKSQGVAVVPGEGFGAKNYIRWSYAASLESIRAGMDRLERFLQG